jgi:hemerythrin-like metal-binding protein
VKGSRFGTRELPFADLHVSAGGGGGNMIFWRDAMSLGSTGLDNDHKRLIDLINSAEQGLARDNPMLLAAVLGDLLDYVDVHFKREEAVQEAIGYPDRVEHKRHHEVLAQKARLLHDKYLSAVTSDEQHKCATMLAQLLHDWLIDHILKEDMRFRPHLQHHKGTPQATVHVGMPPPQPPVPVPVPAPSSPQPSDEQLRQQRLTERNRDLEYRLPPELAHLLERIEYVTPELPPPQGGFASFAELCQAAISHRIDSVLVFFQRHNPRIVRELPQPFLTSPEFAEKFHRACDRLIFPPMRESRQIRLLSTSFEWEGADTVSFWQHVDRQLQTHILESWIAAWDELKLAETRKPDGTRVLQVKDATRELREMLQPSTPEAYDLPKVGNREIETFKSLLDPANDWWRKLNQLWQSCHDLYEQEKDPRIFQMKAREGALRDNLLAVFGRFPDQWGDFLVLACHRVFPRISTLFLENFLTNLGRTDEQRAEYMPYTVRYIQQVRDHPDIRPREQREEAEWQAQMQQLRNYLAGRPPAAAKGPGEPGRHGGAAVAAQSWSSNSSA